MLGSTHVLLIRNNGEDQQGLEEGQGVKEEELGHPHQGGVHVQLDFNSTRIPEPDFTKIDALATYRVGFGCSIYGANQSFIRLQRHQSHLKIPSESTGILETSGHPESVRVLHHHLLGCWPVYRVGDVRVASRGLARS
jgi:hypothetical protein